MFRKRISIGDSMVSAAIAPRQGYGLVMARKRDKKVRRKIGKTFRFGVKASILGSIGFGAVKAARVLFLQRHADSESSAEWPPFGPKVRDAADKAGDAAKHTIDKAADKTKDAAAKVADKVEGLAKKVDKTADVTADKTADMAEEVAEDVSDKTEDAAAEAQESVKKAQGAAKRASGGGKQNRGPSNKNA